MNEPRTHQPNAAPRLRAQRRAAAVVAQYLNELSGRHRPKPQVPVEVRA
jgi:hypothetical protein